MPKVNASFYFQQIPGTVFELLLDPENDIFLVLASKTISNKGNAKVKQGLKKTLDSSGGADAGGDDALPYVVSLEIGGSFNVQGREGTNLLLVSGSKILQMSHMRQWESGIYSTELFDIKPHASGHSIMELTQLNFPSESKKVRVFCLVLFVSVASLMSISLFLPHSPSFSCMRLPLLTMNRSWKICGWPCGRSSTAHAWAQ